MLHLNTPLMNDHSAGAEVVATKADHAVRKEFNATDTARWIRENILLGDVVAAAVAGGEVWRGFRQRQQAFEQRLLPKSVVVADELFRAALVRSATCAVPLLPLASITTLGQVVVAGGSTGSHGARPQLWMLGSQLTQGDVR